MSEGGDSKDPKMSRPSGQEKRWEAGWTRPHLEANKMKSGKDKSGVTQTEHRGPGPLILVLCPPTPMPLASQPSKKYLRGCRNVSNEGCQSIPKTVDRVGPFSTPRCTAEMLHLCVAFWNLQGSIKLLNRRVRSKQSASEDDLSQALVRKTIHSHTVWKPKKSSQFTIQAAALARVRISELKYKSYSHLPWTWGKLSKSPRPQFPILQNDTKIQLRHCAALLSRNSTPLISSTFLQVLNRRKTAGVLILVPSTSVVVDCPDVVLGELMKHIPATALVCLLRCYL